MYKLAGFLIIVNAIVIAAWWLLGEHPYKGWAFSICLTAVFVGAFMILHERVTEVTLEGVGTIKSAVEQATADANSISEIKNRIQSQSATIDLVAMKATETIDQLKFIAKNNAKVTVAQLMAGNFGFKDGLTLAKRLELHDKIIASLKEIGLPPQDIQDADMMWKNGICVIYFRGIRVAFEGRKEPHLINTDASPELLKASKEFQDLLNFEEWDAPSPDEIESFINSKGFMNEKAQALLEDYRHFLTTGEIRRVDVFVEL